MNENLAKCRLGGRADLFRRGLLAWIAAVLVEYLLLPGSLRELSGVAGLGHTSLVRVLLLTGVFFAAQLLIACRVDGKRFERWILVGLVGLLAAVSLITSFNWMFLAGWGLILGLLAVYGLRGWNGDPEPVPQPGTEKKCWLWITVVFSLGFFGFLSLWTVCRIYSFSTPTYDFGIFSQMFYSMKTTGLPMTTVERDGLLSHFAVHVSPIYYLMLPVYWLVPTPAVLQVLQAAVMTSAVIPLWKLGKHYGLPGMQRMLLCGVLLLLPAFAGGASFDLHENCFLTPLVLWLFYGICKKKPILTGVCALLTLTVKEDAAVYVAVIGLWLLFKSLLHRRRREAVTGAALLAVSVLWFLGVTAYLSHSGDGVMSYRYYNYLYAGSSSLLTVIRSVIVCPMKAIYECMDPGKLKFILLTLVPLLGLPLLTRRYEDLLLIIPYILVNLMSDYPYQHDITFQYSFGSTAFLVYLTLISLAGLRTDRVRLTALAAATVVAAGCFAATILPTAKTYTLRAWQRRDYYAQVSGTLSQIPQDAAVAATTFYTTALSQREVLYDVKESSREHLLSAQYVVLNPATTGDYKAFAEADGNGYENLVALLTENGYELFAQTGNTLVIFRKGS